MRRGLNVSKSVETKPPAGTAAMEWRSRPTAAECRAALRRYLPELMSAYEDVCELVGDDDLAHRILSHYRPASLPHGCSQAVWLGDGGPALVRNYDYPLHVVSSRIELTAWSKRRVIANPRQSRAASLKRRCGRTCLPGGQVHPRKDNRGLFGERYGQVVAPFDGNDIDVPPMSPGSRAQRALAADFGRLLRKDEFVPGRQQPGYGPSRGASRNAAHRNVVAILLPSASGPSTS